MRSFLLAFPLLVLTPRMVAQDPVVGTIIGAVELDSLIRYSNELSGEVPVDVGNGPVQILTRNTFQPGNTIARQYMEQKLQSWGYTTSIQVFNGGSGENLLATKTGMVHPGRKVILCGHYDALPGGPGPAPAADDDASGCAAVLEAARIMKDIAFVNTIVFALWDEEEQGKLGSIHYAGVAAANDDSITAVINMDAIAWDGNGDGLMRIHARPVGNSMAIKDTALMVNTQYALGQNIAINTPGATYSDHASFWAEGYGAVLMIEDFDHDPNPRYHTANDRVQYFDQPYFHRIARLSIGTFATFAQPFDTQSAIPGSSGRQDPAGMEAHPNPTDGPLRVRLTGYVGSDVKVALHDPSGRLLDQFQMPDASEGKREHAMDLTAYPEGAYVLRWTSGSSAGAMRVMRTEP